MLKSVEIVYSRSLKLNKGNFQQDAPMWSEKAVLDVSGLPEEMVDLIYAKEYQKIKDRIDTKALTEWNRTALELSGLRVREKDGKKYPSVTSILKPEPYTGSPEYGIRGTELHRICNEYLSTGNWEEPTVKLEKISYDQIKYREFFQKHGERIDNKKVKFNIEVFNDKWMYSGEIDLICKVDGKWTLSDIKTGSWDWPQLVAYEKCNPGKVVQLAIFDLKNNDLCTLPVECDESREHWEHFISKRGEFKAKFGV